MNQDLKKAPEIISISTNRRATFDYSVEKKIEAGICLTGSEVKSCRQGKVQLVDSFASFENGECYLHKAHISEYAQSGPYFNHLATSKRKLLLHKREIKNLRALTEQSGYTLIPLRMYFKNGRVKVEIALAKGKSKGDKRASTKQHEDARQMDRAIKQANAPVRSRSRSSSSYDED